MVSCVWASTGAAARSAARGSILFMGSSSCDRWVTVRHRFGRKSSAVAPTPGCGSVSKGLLTVRGSIRGSGKEQDLPRGLPACPLPMGFPRVRKRKGLPDAHPKAPFAHPAQNLVRPGKKFLPVPRVMPQGGPGKEEPPPGGGGLGGGADERGPGS